MDGVVAYPGILLSYKGMKALLWLHMSTNCTIKYVTSISGTILSVNVQERLRI
jgi:hypothetical protein